MTSAEAITELAELLVGDFVVLLVRAAAWWIKRRADLRRRAIAPLA